MSMDKWFKHLEKFGVKTIPWHGVRPNGSCTCLIKGCTNKGDHPLEGFSLEAFEEDRWPYANIAIDACEGVAVLEVTKDGRENWSELKEKHGIKKTWVAKGSSGSWLVFFKRPTDLLSVRPWGNGMSIRKDPILAPPSLRPDGKRLQWIVAPWECKLASIHGSLLVLVANQSRQPRGDQSATREFVRRTYFSQEGKHESPKDRMECVLKKTINFNKDNCPSISEGDLYNLVEGTIQGILDSNLPPVPQQAIEAASLLGGEIVDHLTYREAGK